VRIEVQLPWILAALTSKIQGVLKTKAEESLRIAYTREDVNGDRKRQYGPANFARRPLFLMINKIDANHGGGARSCCYLPGWDSLSAVTRYHNWAELAGIVVVALLVVTEIVAYKYGHRKDDMTEQQQIATNQRHDEKCAASLETAKAKRACCGIKYRPRKRTRKNIAENVEKRTI